MNYRSGINNKTREGDPLMALPGIDYFSATLGGTIGFNLRHTGSEGEFFGCCTS